MLLQEETEKLEHSLKDKVQQRVDADQRLRSLIEEEQRLTDVLTETGRHRDCAQLIKAEMEFQQRELAPEQTEEEDIRLLEGETNNREVQLNRKAEELNRREAYLRRLEYEL